MTSVWNKTSWRNHERIQMPEYQDMEKLGEVENRLRSYPPLVFAGEARNLTKQDHRVRQ